MIIMTMILMASEINCFCENAVHPFYSFEARYRLDDLRRQHVINTQNRHLCSFLVGSIMGFALDVRRTHMLQSVRLSFGS